MRSNKRPVSHDQARYEVATSRGFVVWIAVYLALVLVFVISSHHGGHHAIASHSANGAISAPHTALAIVSGRPRLIAHGS